MKTFVTIALFFGSFLCGKAQADVCNTPDNLVTNCGFETGNLTGWLQAPASEAGNWFGVDRFDAYTGRYGAYLGGFGSYATLDNQYALIGQSVGTVVGRQYVFSYDWAHNTSGDPTAVPDNYFTAGLNGFSVVSSQQVNVGAQSYTRFGYEFTANSANTFLEFEAEDANFYFSLDDVSLTPAPESASFGLLAAALSGFWLLGQIRKARR